MATPVPQPDTISSVALAALHPEVIESEAEIDRILGDLIEGETELVCGYRLGNEARSARLTRASGGVLALVGIRPSEVERRLFFRFHLRGRPYFLSADVLGPSTVDGQTEIRRPLRIYRAERRDRRREPASGSVTLVSAGRGVAAELMDKSGGGLCLRMAGYGSVEANSAVAVQSKGWTRYGVVSRVRQVGPGQSEVGIAYTARSRCSLPIESLDLRRSRPTVGEPSGVRTRRVTFSNTHGQHISAIVDHVGSNTGAMVAVVIPPAWGHTKETLLRLSLVVSMTLGSAGMRASVLRYDATQRRGESYRDPQSAASHMHSSRFTFSSGVTDLDAAVAFSLEDLGADKVVIVSFSSSAIEARRVVATRGDRIAGWIGVVGAPDAQSLLRTVSGGIDFLGGSEQGLTFGHQEIQGQLLDIDRAARDAIENGFAFLSDAFDDFERIAAPITWLAAQNDGWIDPNRALGAVSCGRGDRRFVLLPTGHQLRSSEDAGAVFGFIAAECARMSGQDGVVPRMPDTRSLRRRQVQERRAVSMGSREIVEFWKRYLVGREGAVGFRLLSCTSAYRALLRSQLQELQPEPGWQLADLGSGLGSLASALGSVVGRGDGRAFKIVELDVVPEAMRSGADRERQRLLRRDHVAADLGFSQVDLSIPLRSCSVDGAMASLLINYLSEPGRFFEEVFRVLRPKGRLVLSSLRPDADISVLLRDGLLELRAGIAAAGLSPEEEERFERSLPGFLNDAASLLDLEQQGAFRFYEVAELTASLESAGFRVTSSRDSFGVPPQAYVVSATKP